MVRPAPLVSAQSSRCRCPARLDLGETELELHPAEGHTADGCALFARAPGLLVVGDYLSDVELPMISEGGSLAGYRATLARLAPLVEEAETVVPGHGSPHDQDTALRILDEDVDYLDALERGEERPALPEGRSSRAQRRLHAENLARRLGDSGDLLLVHPDRAAETLAEHRGHDAHVLDDEGRPSGRALELLVHDQRAHLVATSAQQREALEITAMGRQQHHLERLDLAVLLELSPVRDALVEDLEALRLAAGTCSLPNR